MLTKSMALSKFNLHFHAINSNPETKIIMIHTVISTSLSSSNHHTQGVILNIPEIIWDPIDMIFKSLGIWSIGMPSNKHLNHLGDL